MSNTLTIKRRGFIFDWAGGPYIEIARDTASERAFDVVNVSGTDQPFTKLGLTNLVQGWIDSFDRPQDAFAHLRDTAHNVLDY